MFGYKDLKAAFINSHCTCNYLNSSNNKKNEGGSIFSGWDFSSSFEPFKEYKTKKNYIQSTCVDIYIHIMLLLYFVAQKNGKPTGK